MRVHRDDDAPRRPRLALRSVRQHTARPWMRAWTLPVSVLGPVLRRTEECCEAGRRLAEPVPVLCVFVMQRMKGAGSIDRSHGRGAGEPRSVDP